MLQIWTTELQLKMLQSPKQKFYNTFTGASEKKAYAKNYINIR